METIIKQSADGLILSRNNNFDTNLGKVFINKHEITDIDTFFKVAEENTRLLEQVKKQKEVIDKAIETLEKGITFCENDSQGIYDKCNIAINREKKVLDILKGGQNE